MKQHKKAKLVVGFISMMIVGSLIAFMAEVENGFFQFCTTKAYGWPLPWKIDYCLCEGGTTVFPIFNIFVNLGIIFGFGALMFFVSGAFFKSKHKIRSKKVNNRVKCGE